VTGNGAYEGEMSDVATFVTALRAAVPTQPDPRLGAELVPRLAEAARAATVEAEMQSARRRPRSRLARVARVGIAVAAIPLFLAGLAFAGVTVPEPARNAFDSVGIELPNQPSSDSSSQATDQGTNGPADSTKSETSVSGGGNSSAAHQHALQQRSKAKGKALGHTRGKAIGLNESTPPGQSGDTGPPPHSNVGGSAQSQSAPGRVRSPGPPHPPRGRSGAHGH
jgi:cell division protein FtsN